MQTLAIRYHTFGRTEDVLQLEELPLPARCEGQVLLKILAAPINPADFGRVAGSYGELAILPAVAGLEGVAEILESSSDHLPVGSRVFVPSLIGSWQSHAFANAEELFPVPEKLPLETAAMGWVNPPTAWKLMNDFVKLQAGDTIVQNAASSALGKLVIQFAHHLGIRTVNLVRSLDSAEALKKLGANFVFLDHRDSIPSALEALGGAKAKLAFNSVGGNSALNQCKFLGDGGTLVTVGGMEREPAPFPTRYLIFNDITIKGFWISKWYRGASRNDILALHKKLFTFMENAKIAIDVTASYPLSQYKEALKAATQASKPGKILFKPNG